MRQSVWAATVVALVLSLSAATQATTVWDRSADWTADGSTTYGQWSIGADWSPGGNAPNPYWPGFTWDQGRLSPNIPGGGVSWQASQTQYSQGTYFELSVFTLWTSPIDGQVQVSIPNFCWEDYSNPGNRTAQLEIYTLQGTTPTSLASVTLSPGQVYNILTSEFAVAMGEKVYFKMRDVTGGAYYGDAWTTFMPTVTLVPEPVTCVLLSVGGLWMVRRRTLA